MSSEEDEEPARHEQRTLLTAAPARLPAPNPVLPRERSVRSRGTATLAAPGAVTHRPPAPPGSYQTTVGAALAALMHVVAVPLVLMPAPLAVPFVLALVLCAFFVVLTGLMDPGRWLPFH